MVIIEWILLLFIVIPGVTLVHELGHAAAVVLFTKDGTARIYLGSTGEENKENFRMGRVHFHLKWGLTGFCSYQAEEQEFIRWKRILFMLFGPLTSLFVALAIFVMLLNLPISGLLRDMMQMTVIFAFTQFLFTFIPMKYPRLFPGYRGLYSDGYWMVKI